MDIQFRPVQGLEADILNTSNHPGFVYFATDTKKIYLDTQDQSKLPMGGNSGIYYGHMTLDYEPDTDEKVFDFTILDIDGNTNSDYRIPNIDDLIVNSDGCLYRVTDLQGNDINAIIVTEKLTLAGGGGSVGPGGVVSRLTIVDAQGTTQKYFTKDIDSAILQFIVSSTAPDGNKVTQINYTIGAIDAFTDDNVHEFDKPISLDITKYISKLSSTDATKITIQVYDLMGAIKTFTYWINIIDLSLTSNYTNTILTTKEETLTYSCTPRGGKTLSSRAISVTLKDSNGKTVDTQITEIATAGVEIPLQIVLPGFNAYLMEVAYIGQLPNGNWESSNILSYTAVRYNETTQLVAGALPKRIEQYSTLNVPYMLVKDTTSTNKIAAILEVYEQNADTGAITKISTSEVEIPYNTIQTWSIYFDKEGVYNLQILSGSLKLPINGINVYRYEGEVPSINTSGLTLNLTTTGRSNNEQNREKWGDVDCTFDNFSWGTIDGWLKDKNGVDVLHLAAGAKVTIDYEPFKQDVFTTGQTIELDFKFSGTTDFSQPLISCLSYTDEHKTEILSGFILTGEKSTMDTQLIKTSAGFKDETDDEKENEKILIYNTAIQGLTSYYVEDERIHLTWTIDQGSGDGAVKYPMVRTYINGILSAITTYDSVDDKLIQNYNLPAKIILDSTYGNIDIYNIRVYQTIRLAPSTVVNNYIATLDSITDRVDKYFSNSNVVDSNSEISITEIENNYISKDFILPTPYIKIIGGRKLSKSDVTGDYSLTADNSKCELPTTKKDYRLIESYEFVDQSGIRDNIKWTMPDNAFDGNILKNGIIMYGQGTSSMEYPVKNLRFKSKAKKTGTSDKLLFAVNDCDVDLVCLKADYMESSGSHNTGTGNLIYSIAKGMSMKSPAQERYNDYPDVNNDNVDYDVLTAIRGFPVLVFFKPADDLEAEYTFVGRYNFNLDKATQEPFGFFSSPEENPGTDLPSDSFGWIDATKNPELTDIVEGLTNAIHCYEFKNNSHDLVKFIYKFDASKPDITNFEELFKAEWPDAYEARYPEDDTDTKAFLRLCKWLNSTSKDEATNAPLNSVVTYGQTQYTHDTAEYRLAKFENEFNEYLDFNFTAFYYILTHVLLMIDSRAKNMMIATWDNTIWYPIFYDMDTMLGLNNYGFNKFSYDTEDTESNVYNGQDSVLWNNFREVFTNSEEFLTFYNNMQTNGMSYANLLTTLNKKQADAVNENIYNADSVYKYQRPFEEGYFDGRDTADGGGWVQPGQRNYLYASQGPRSMHRKFWLKNRFNYLNGKYISNSYKQNRYEMRLYTPQAEGDNFYSVPNLTEEEFYKNVQSGTQYYKYNEQLNRYEEIDTYDINTTYYLKAIPSKLQASIKAVPPNNNFTLTPLKKQYISVAYGGDNGDLIGPIKTLANEQASITTTNTYNDTETYIYGGSLLKDLGDLSPQYLGQLKFPNEETKLETLVLGNLNNNYYNPNFSSLDIGGAAPYLKVLNIANCTGLATIDVSQCRYLKEVQATGSGITNIALCPYSAIETLRLPGGLRSLSLIGQSNLKTLTIGSYDSNAQQYIDAEKLQILSLKIEDTPIDTYALTKKCLDSLGEGAYFDFKLININWNISNPEDIDTINSTINILERLSKCIENASPHLLTGTLTLNCQTLGISANQALAIYEKYNILDVEHATRYFPNLKFKFIFDAGANENIYDVNIYDGNEEVIWTRKICSGDSMDSNFLNGGPNGAFNIEDILRASDNEWNYNFLGGWQVYNADTKDLLESIEEGNPIYSEAVESNLAIKPDFEKEFRLYTLKFYGENYPVDDEEPYYEIQIGYDSKFSPESTSTPFSELHPFPYKDESELSLKEAWDFQGYSLTPGGPLVDKNSTIYTDTNFYAVFKYEEDITKVVHEDYFTYTKTGYVNPNLDIDVRGTWAITPKRGLESNPPIQMLLKGKITIPTSYNDISVTGLNNPYPDSSKSEFKAWRQVTHIFMGPGSQLRTTGSSIFGQADKDSLGDYVPQLQYFDFTPNTIKLIGWGAFGCCHFNEDFEQILPESLTALQSFAFRYAIFDGGVELNIPNTLISLEHQIFHDCTFKKLISLTIPEGLTIASNNVRPFSNSKFPELTVLNWDDGFNPRAGFSFIQAPKLIELNLPSSLTEIADEAFHGCGFNSIEKLTIPKHVTHIGEKAFQSCNFQNLKELNLPTGLIEIKSYAFNQIYAVGLKGQTIKIPSTVTTVGSQGMSYWTIENPLSTDTSPKMFIQIGEASSASQLNININVETFNQNSYYTLNFYTNSYTDSAALSRYFGAKAHITIIPVTGA